MKASIELKDKTYQTDFSKPLDISIGLRGDAKNPVVWYLSTPEIKPVKDGAFIGKVSEGASVNFNSIWFNPHAHGTHTECVGHISREFYSINQSLQTFFFLATLISVEPETKGGDKVISEAVLKEKLQSQGPEALIIRTLPNFRGKQTRNYSHSNWPYLSEAAAVYLRNCGVKHLLIDLPSVDKEIDNGRLLAHKAFWNYPRNTRYEATITELVFVPNSVVDGDYLLNLQLASFENDASPSKPVLYKIQ